MKVKLVGKNLDGIIPYLEKYQIEIDDKSDLILIHGGDGSLLGAERKYPNLIKFPIRDAKTAPLCKKHNYDYQINQLHKSQLQETNLPKLVAQVNDKQTLGINDIIIHNADRVSAVRYKVFINDKLYAEDIVGDGICVATVHGSTAYYRSITHSIFQVGIGLAFNNSTELTNHLVINDNSKITVQILRGPALVTADNSRDFLALATSDIVTISKSDQFAKTLGLDFFMCPDCRKIRHSRDCKHLRD